jgi:type 1 fimbria pilin
MKNKLTIWSGVAVLALVAWASPSFAADTDKEVTIKGEGKCAKCALHETEKCQNVIETKDKSGKKVVYYLAKNDVSDEFHGKICKGPQKVTAKGTVKEVDGKKELTVSKIELAKGDKDKE